METLGKWAFIAGLIVAVVAAFMDFAWVPWVLAILGLIVGFLNVSEGESQHFLIAAIGLLLSATAIRSVPFIGDTGTVILGNVSAFIAAAILIVALRSLFATARS